MRTARDPELEDALKTLGDHYPQEAMRLANALDPESPVAKSDHHEAHSLHVLVKRMKGQILDHLDSHTTTDPTEQVVTIVSQLIHEMNAMGYRKVNTQLIDLIDKRYGGGLSPTDSDEPKPKAKGKSKPAPAKDKAKPAKSKPKAASESSEG